VTFSCAEVVPTDDSTFDTEADYQQCHSYFINDGSAFLFLSVFVRVRIIVMVQLLVILKRLLLNDYCVELMRYNVLFVCEKLFTTM
jgi:hypothetical protein